MKRNILLMLVIVVLLACNAKKPITNIQKLEMTENIGNIKIGETKRYVVSANNSINQPDSSFITTIDTSLSKKDYPITYAPKPEDVAFLKPYFVDDICKPGDYKHPTYKYMEKKAGKLNTMDIINSWIANLKDYPDAKERIIKTCGSLTKLYDCRLEFMPTYYLTPNVVNFKPNEIIDKYFTLDTTKLYYRLYQNKKLIGIINYTENLSSIRGLFPRELEMNKMEVLNKLDVIPIGLNCTIILPERSSFREFYSYGFIKNNRLFTLQMGYSSSVVRSSDVSIKDKYIFEKEIIVKSVNQLFFAQNTSGAITMDVKSTIDYINNYLKK